MVNNPINSQTNPRPPPHPVVNFTVAAAFGYACYGLTRLLPKWDTYTKIDWANLFSSLPKHPFPFILFPVAITAVIEGAQGVRKIAPRIFGDRARYETAPLLSDARIDRFRRCCWRVVVVVEGYQKRVDTAYSNVFGIRTVEEIAKQKLEDRHLYFFEIFRRAVVDQTKETVNTIIPQEIAVYTMQAFGYALVSAALINEFALICFACGVFTKVVTVYKKRQEEEDENLEWISLLAEPDPDSPIWR